MTPLPAKDASTNDPLDQCSEQLLEMLSSIDTLNMEIIHNTASGVTPHDLNMVIRIINLHPEIASCIVYSTGRTTMAEVMRGAISDHLVNLYLKSQLDTKTNPLHKQHTPTTH